MPQLSDSGLPLSPCHCAFGFFASEAKSTITPLGGDFASTPGRQFFCFYCFSESNDLPQRFLRRYRRGACLLLIRLRPGRAKASPETHKRLDGAAASSRIAQERHGVLEKSGLQKNMRLGARRRASCFFAEDHSSVNIGHSKKHEAPCTVTKALAKKQEPPWQQNEVSAKLLEPFHRVRWRMFFCRGDRALSPCLLLFCKRLFGRTRAVRFFSRTLAPVHQGPAKNQATPGQDTQAHVFGDRRRRVARRRPIFCKRLRRQEDRVPPFARP